MYWKCPKCSSSSLSVTHTCIQYLDVDPEIISSSGGVTKMRLTSQNSYTDSFTAKCNGCSTTFRATIVEGNKVLIYPTIRSS